MLKNLKRLGDFYRLGKRKDANKFEVCTVKGDWLLSMADGKKVCKQDDRTRWRYFRESEYLTKKNEGYSPNDRIKSTDEEGHEAWFYVIEVGEEDVKGEIKLVVGL